MYGQHDQSWLIRTKGYLRSWMLRLLVGTSAEIVLKWNTHLQAQLEEGLFAAMRERRIGLASATPKAISKTVKARMIRGAPSETA